MSFIEVFITVNMIEKGLLLFANKKLPIQEPYIDMVSVIIIKTVYFISLLMCNVTTHVSFFLLFFFSNVVFRLHQS